MNLPILRWRTRSWLGGMGVAVAATLLAAAIRAMIGVFAPAAVPFAPFILAVLMATLISGYPAGLMTLTAGLLIVWRFFLPPTASFVLPAPNEIASPFLFILAGVGEIIVAEAIRRGVDRESAREQRLARAQAVGGVGDWEWNLSNDQFTWSENLYRLMGRDPRDFQPTRDSLASFVHPDDITGVVKALGRAIAKASGFEMEFRGIWPDGTPRHFVSRGEVVKDRAGKPARLMAVIIDITERRRTEDALVRSEERYRQLFNAMSEAYVVHDIVYDQAGEPIDFRAIEANPAFETHTGLRREAVVGKLASEFAAGGDPIWLRFFSEVVRKGEPDRIERYSTVPGRWIDLCAFPLGGARFGIIFNDVTERKLAEAEREAAEARLAAAMQIAEVGAFDYDPATGMVAPSGSCDAIHGWDDGVTERPLSAYLARLRPEDALRFEAEVERALGQRDSFGLEYRIPMGDDGERWVASRGAVISDSKGERRLVGAIFDITVRKQTELEREAARDHVEMLFREMNHRTKNNLAIVSSMLSLQASGARPHDDIREHLRAARERIATIAELHTSLYQGAVLGQVDFADYIRNVCALIENSFLSADRGIAFIVKADAVSLSADIAVPLGLVVNELATNAIKHAFVEPAVDPQIEVSVSRLAGDLRLCVRDNGQGLPEEGWSQGRGLGARLIDALISQIGGRLTVSRNDGTQFDILIPT